MLASCITCKSTCLPCLAEGRRQAGKSCYPEYSGIQIGIFFVSNLKKENYLL